jgi:D-alanyl-D-alanine carboxypeptidase
MTMNLSIRVILPATLLLIGLILSGCRSEPAGAVPQPVAAAADTIATPAPLATSRTTEGTAPPPATVPPSPSVTPTPSATPTVTPMPTPTPTSTPSPTPIGPCAERVPEDDLLILVSRTYPISRYYEPADLVPLADYFSVEETLGYPLEVREIIVAPLQALMRDMQAAGLQPFIISGYRSYAAQAIAREKWASRYPDWVDQISSIPGTSEHQLGTTIDFGSPELESVVGQPGIEFHTYFYMTSEGAWLLEHAHEYGFTLSYPREALEVTGFYYEPWHYRYVGVELATRLKAQEKTLTAYLLETQPAPCISADE